MVNMLFFMSLEKLKLKILWALCYAIAKYYLKKEDQAYIIFNKYISLKSISSLFLNELSFILKLPYSFHLLSLHLELTNFCNLSCSMCHGTNNMSRKKGYMDIHLIEQI